MDNANNRFQREYILNLKFLKKYINLSILFNKNNLYTSYHVDQQTYCMCKNRYSLNVCFDLKKSRFCQTFLDISDYKSENCDIVNAFNGIFTQYRNLVFYDNQESIHMDKVLMFDSFVENKLDIHVFRLYKFDREFLFCLCSRQYIDNKFKRKIVRSSAFNLMTKDCHSYLDSLYKKYYVENKFESCEDAMMSLFDDKKDKQTCDITPQQRQNGVIL